MATVSELRQAAQWVERSAARANTAAFMGAHQALRDAAECVGKAWSGSWLPRFANLYDRNLLPVPQRLRLQAGGGNEVLPPALQIRCRDWSPQEIRETIYARADQPGDGALRDHAIAATALLDEALVTCIAPLGSVAAQRASDSELAGLLAAAQQLSVADDSSVVEAWRPQYARLHAAKARGYCTPPEHLRVLAMLEALLSPFDSLRRLAQLMRTAADHLDSMTTPRVPAGLLAMVAGGPGLLPSRRLADSC